jgi:hypothetical protein
MKRPARKTIPNQTNFNHFALLLSFSREAGASLHEMSGAGKMP